LLVNTRPRVIGEQDGLGDGLGFATATGAEAATDGWLKVGTAALTELNWKAAPATAPKVIPPTRTTSLLIFIVAHTTPATRGSIRNDPNYRLCITS
jgi:hypothetical protein